MFGLFLRLELNDRFCPLVLTFPPHFKNDQHFIIIMTRSSFVKVYLTQIIFFSFSFSFHLFILFVIFFYHPNKMSVFHLPLSFDGGSVGRAKKKPKKKVKIVFQFTFPY